LVKYPGPSSDNDIVGLNMPKSIAMIYELNIEIKPIRHYYLGGAEAAAKTAAVAAPGKT